MTQEELLTKIMFGIEYVGEGAKRDFKAVVSVNNKPEELTDEDIEVLARFSQEISEQYYGWCANFSGANYFIVSKLEHRWLLTKLSWEYGRGFPTFAELEQQAWGNFNWLAMPDRLMAS